MIDNFDAVLDQDDSTTDDVLDLSALFSDPSVQGSVMTDNGDTVVEVRDAEDQVLAHITLEGFTLDSSVSFDDLVTENIIKIA